MLKFWENLLKCYRMLYDVAFDEDSENIAGRLS